MRPTFRHMKSMPHGQIRSPTIGSWGRWRLAGNGGSDHIVLKMSRDGQRLLTIGQPNETGGSNDDLACVSR